MNPLIPALTEYSLKEFSCQSYFSLKNILVLSYNGKYIVWKRGMQNTDIEYPKLIKYYDK